VTSVNEETLIQQTTADYLERWLCWESAYAITMRTSGLWFWTVRHERI